MFGKKRRFSRHLINYGKVATKQLKRPRPRLAKIKRFMILLIFMLLIILAIYLILFSGYFKIKNITIDTNEDEIEGQVLNDQITSSLSQSLGKSLITINLENLEIKILDLFPEIEEVKVKKDYPSTLQIEFMEYPLTANVITESPTLKKNYIINSIGFAVKENLENPSLPYIRIKSDEPVNPESTVIEATKLRYILDTITYFEDKFGMRIIEVEYKKIPREIQLLTEKNFYIWLDIQKSYEEQLKKLKKSLVKLDIFSEPLEYIDLRITGSNGDKIIYKRK
ncbi:MAG: FtsQ-type POTRA domain-containing protein [Candidatus Peregrinibacteria bacterium]